MFFFLTLRVSYSIYTIAVNEEPPFSMCSIPFKGFEVDLLTSALSLSGWRYNEQFNFTCSTNATNFSAAIGRVQMDQYRYSIGYSYSYPTFNLQLGILAYSSLSSSSLKILSILSPGLWVFILFYSLFLSVFLIFFEHIPNGRFADWFNNLKLISWISLSSIFFAEQGHKYRLPSKIVVFTSLLFNLFAFLLFMSGCMAFAYKNVKLIDFPEKLENMRYDTYTDYLDYTTPYGGFFVDDGITSLNIQDKLYLLKNKDIDAIVMEYETVTNIARTHCDYVVSSKPFSSFFFAVEILPGVNTELKTQIDLGLTKLNSQFDVESLKNAYFYEDNICTSQLNYVSSIDMYQFIEIFAGYALSVILTFLLRAIWSKSEMQKEKNKFVESVKEIISRPEIKIAKNTQRQIRHQDQELNSLMLELEKYMRSTTKVQDKLLVSIRSKQIEGR